jgi:hypothetical protein
MVAAFGFCDEPEPGLIAPPAIVTGIHLTRLTPEGEKIAGDKLKIMLGRMPGIAAALPDYVECVRIFAHRDNPDDGGAGIRYAQEAARLIAAKGVDVKIHPF